MKEKYISHVLYTGKVGDLAYDPVTNIYGIIVEVKKIIDTKAVTRYGYRIEWQDPVLNKRERYWGHYEVCVIPN